MLLLNFHINLSLIFFLLFVIYNLSHKKYCNCSIILFSLANSISMRNRKSIRSPECVCIGDIMGHGQVETLFCFPQLPLRVLILFRI